MRRSQPSTLGHVTAVAHTARVVEALGDLGLDHALSWRPGAESGWWEFELLRLPRLPVDSPWPGRRWFQWTPESGWSYRVPGTEVEIWVRHGVELAWMEPEEIARTIDLVAQSPRVAWSGGTFYPKGPRRGGLRAGAPVQNEQSVAEGDAPPVSGEQ